MARRATVNEWYGHISEKKSYMTVQAMDDGGKMYPLGLKPAKGDLIKLDDNVFEVMAVIDGSRSGSHPHVTVRIRRISVPAVSS